MSLEPRASALVIRDIPFLVHSQKGPRGLPFALDLVMQVTAGSVRSNNQIPLSVVTKSCGAARGMLGTGEEGGYFAAHELRGRRSLVALQLLTCPRQQPVLFTTSLLVLLGVLGPPVTQDRVS